jgi:hypothetical protein
MVRPCAPHHYSPPRRSAARGSRFHERAQTTACATTRPRARGDRFPRSAPEPEPSSRHLHAGHHLANQQAPARLVPGPQSIPGFDVIYRLSTRHQWFADARLRDPHLPRSTARHLPRRSPPRLLTAAARGGLRPPPTRRPRRATRPTGPVPPSLAQHRLQRPDPLHQTSFNVRVRTSARRAVALVDRSGGASIYGPSGPRPGRSARPRQHRQAALRRPVGRSVAGLGADRLAGLDRG